MAASLSPAYMPGRLHCLENTNNSLYLFKLSIESGVLLLQKRLDYHGSGSMEAVVGWPRQGDVEEAKSISFLKSQVFECHYVFYSTKVHVCLYRHYPVVLNISR